MRLLPAALLAQSSSAAVCLASSVLRTAKPLYPSSNGTALSSSSHQIQTWPVPAVSQPSSRPNSSSVAPVEPPGATVTVVVDCPAHGSNCTAPPTVDEAANSSAAAPVPVPPCTPIPEDRPVTHFSVVYTSTVTFFGNRSHYTPPFEPLATPNYCHPTIAPFAPPHPSAATPLLHHFDPAARKGFDRHAFRPSLTFITTDKNPSVAFPSDPPPRYTPTWGRLVDDHGNANHKSAFDPGGRGDGDTGSGQHMTAASGDRGASGDHRRPGGHRRLGIVNHGSGYHEPANGAGVKSVGNEFPTPDAARVKQARGPTFKITARGNQVTINRKTFSDLEPGKTSIVTARGVPFTILPNAIVGAGATIQKPAPAGTVVLVATPTSGVAGGLPVELRGTEAVVGGKTLTLAEEGTATVVNGQRVSAKPGALYVGTEVLTFAPVMPSREKEMLVKGGELLTAIGSSVVVIHATTFTYGPGTKATARVVNGDTIYVEPSGVFAHGTCIGGPSANATETRFEVVGGATITRVAPSLAVINGATFTIGPGTRWTTTVIAGEAFTIGPTGVVMSTLTLKYPFGLAVTSTVRATGTSPNDLPVETAVAKNVQGDADDGDQDSKGSLASPHLRIGWAALSIAVGVHLWM